MVKLKNGRQTFQTGTPGKFRVLLVLRCIDTLSDGKRTTTWPHKAHRGALAAASAHAATDADQVCIDLIFVNSSLL